MYIYPKILKNEYKLSTNWLAFEDMWKKCNRSQ